jgi:transposase
MKQLDQDNIRTIEDEITRTIIQKYDVARECLLFDNTNFFTYIDTNTPATLAMRGKSKEKRSDLKIVGLSMMVSPDHSIPLFHEVYPGNTHDSKQFAAVVERLKSRFAGLGKGGCRITIIFDKGNNSESNIEAAIGDEYKGFDFVGGLRFNQCPEFNTIGLENFSQLNAERLKGTSAYRTTKHIYGRELTVVLTYNEALYEAQLDGVAFNIEKCAEKLKALEKSLNDRSNQEHPKGKPPTLEGVKKSIGNILSADYMKELFVWNVWKEIKGCIQMNSVFNDNAFEKLKAERLGRAILFTNHDEWSTEQIISVYRSQYHIEEAFRRMKDSKYLSFRPIHHFTDTNIRVHAFYCVLSLLLASLLKKELEKMGYKLSVHKILEEFQDIRQVITIFPSEGKKKHNVSSFTHMEGFAKEYINKFDLTKLAVNF